MNRGDKYYDPLFAYGTASIINISNPNIPMLSEALQRQAIDSESYPIYQGGVKAPYEMSLFSGQKTASAKKRVACPWLSYRSALSTGLFKKTDSN